MSLERACVNCERCYNLSDELMRDADVSEDEIKTYANQDLLDKAKKLEDEYKNKQFEHSMDRPSTLQKIYYNKCQVNDEMIQSVRLNPEFRKKQQLYQNDRVYSARNEAMKSLWDIVKLGSATSYARVASIALKSCRKCDYSSPKIVETIGGNANRAENSLNSSPK